MRRPPEHLPLMAGGGGVRSRGRVLHVQRRRGPDWVRRVAPRYRNLRRPCLCCRCAPGHAGAERASLAALQLRQLVPSRVRHPRQRPPHAQSRHARWRLVPSRKLPNPRARCLAASLRCVAAPMVAPPCALTVAGTAPSAWGPPRVHSRPAARPPRPRDRALPSPPSPRCCGGHLPHMGVASSRPPSSYGRGGHLPHMGAAATFLMWARRPPSSCGHGVHALAYSSPPMNPLPTLRAQSASPSAAARPQ